MDSTKILNGVAINGSSDGLVRQTGTWHLSTKKKTLTLDSYKSWERWDTNRETHIATVYASLVGSRTRAT